MTAAEWFPQMPDRVFDQYLNAYRKVLQQRGERPCWRVYRHGLHDFIAAHEAIGQRPWEDHEAHDEPMPSEVLADLSEATDLAERIGDAVGEWETR